AALTLRTDRITALFNLPYGIQQQSSHLNDGRVGAAQVLLGAVIDRAHALLDRQVLGIGAFDTCEVDSSLAVAAQAVVVARVRLQLERAGEVVLGDAPTHPV